MTDHADAAAPRPRGLRALYAWMLAKAESRHAWAALAGFAFAEASFFPLPPDLMLVPMMLADRRRAFALAAWCTFWSVVGGMLGYAIGALFWNTAGLWLVDLLHIPLSTVDALRDKYASHAWAIAVQGLTPIPFKLVTISAGLANVPFAQFLFFAAIARSFRFLVLEATAVHFVGERARGFIEKRLEVVFIAFLALVVLGFVALKYLF
jgi:membrane protein YqaA with SNARE-associated domain